SAAPAAVQAMPAPEQLATLFGPSRPTTASDAAPPATDLRLTLVGSFVHADPQRSSAIVQREGGKPQRYASGSELERGIRLHGVYRDRIELERNGRLETLLFPTRSQAQAGRSYSPPSESASALDQLDNLDNLEEENAALLRERMDALRQQMEAGNPMPGAEPTDEPMESD
ncbi:MAG TPA: type II secretion system protein N, partial [Pseudomonas sp.]|nr:type II secretion system protein N [Pseudomonas sp.]